MTIMLLEGTRDTLYMTLLATFFGYVFGLPMGIALMVTAKDGIQPSSRGGQRVYAVIYKILDVIVNITRSTVFDSSDSGYSADKADCREELRIGSNDCSAYDCGGSVIARMVESSLKEVDRGVIEAAQSMGASTGRIIWSVLLVEARTSLLVGVTIAIGTILGYSAMAGAVGGGGLGDIAIRYGYYRYQTDVMLVTIVILVLLVQILQSIGMMLSKKLDRRR